MRPETALVFELNDIVLPEPVSWVPQTPGSWMLAGALLLVLLWLLGAAVRRYRANRYRRQELSRLQTLQEAAAVEETRAAALAAIPVLVKQTALVAALRRDVAGLTGEAWLEFLDESYGDRGFTTGPGQLLPVLAYRSPIELREVSAAEIEALIELVGAWIRRHRVRV